MERDVCIYLAGLYDGEGCFMIALSEGNGGTKYSAQIRLAMTDKDTIDWVAQQFGRTSERHGLSQKVSGKAKPMYRIVLQNIEAMMSFIEQVRPFLRVKARAADLVYEFCKSRVSSSAARGKKCSNHIPYSDFEKGLHAQLKVVNRIGLVAGKVG